MFLLELLAASNVHLTLCSCTHTFFSLTEKLTRQVGEMAQQVRVIATLPEDPCWIAHNHLGLHFKGSQCPPLSSIGICIHVHYTNTRNVYITS